jgi:hypothetical protein
LVRVVFRSDADARLASIKVDANPNFTVVEMPAVVLLKVVAIGLERLSIGG